MDFIKSGDDSKIVYGYGPVSPYGTYGTNGDPRNYDDSELRPVRRPVYQEETSPSVDEEQRGLYYAYIMVVCDMVVVLMI